MASELRSTEFGGGWSNSYGKFFDVVVKREAVRVTSLTGCSNHSSRDATVTAYACAGSAEGKENDGAQWRRVGQGVFKGGGSMCTIVRDEPVLIEAGAAAGFLLHSPDNHSAVAFAGGGNSVFKLGEAFARARNAVAPTSISSSQAGANSAPSQMNLFWVRHS